MRGWVLLGFAVLVGACGKSSQSGDDLGFGRDAVVTADGGGRGDAGFAEDAVGGGDAAVDRDSGSVPDASGSPDALDAPDAGGSPDAGDSLDALGSPDGGDSDTGVADSGPADAGPRPIGAPCSVDPDCAGGAFCSSRATALVSPPQGFCTKFCLDPSECGLGNTCTPPISSLGFCYPVCTSTGGCGYAGLACSPTKYQGLPLPGPGCLPSNPLANDGDPCDGPAECKPNSICLNNQYWYPHGFCAQMDCGATTCAPGARCVVDDQNVALCRKTCLTGSDCRDGYICTPGGLCDIAGPAFAGSPCTTARDCGAAGSHFECIDVDLSTTTPSICTLTNCIPGQESCGPYTCESLRSCPPASECYVPGPNEPFQLPYCRPR